MPALEQLYATSIRIAGETTPGSMEADVNGWHLPGITEAAVEREIILSAERRNFHRQLARREIIASEWQITTRHEATIPLVEWILQAILTDHGSGRWALDPKSPDRSFVIETTTDAGAIHAYAGCRIAEIQLVWDERKILLIDITWQGTSRHSLEAAIDGTAGPDLSGPLLTTRAAGFAVATDAWGTDPRIDNAAVMFAGQVFLTRDIQAGNIGPDGIASTMERAPWTVMAEIQMPETPGITDQAFADQWCGKLAFWFGSGSHHLRLNNVVGFIADGDLKAFDFRIRRLVAEAESDPNLALMEFRA